MLNEAQRLNLPCSCSLWKSKQLCGTTVCTEVLQGLQRWFWWCRTKAATKSSVLRHQNKEMQVQASECKTTTAEAYLCGRRSYSSISFAEQEAAVVCECSTDATTAYLCRRRCTTAYLNVFCVFWRKQNTFYTGEQEHFNIEWEQSSQFFKNRNPKISSQFTKHEVLNCFCPSFACRIAAHPFLCVSFSIIVY